MHELAASGLTHIDRKLSSCPLQVDEQRRQAEADKLAAITELETKSKQFMTEKKEKQQLEQKIASLQGQMIIGGDGLQVTPAVRYADSSPCSCMHRIPWRHVAA